MNTTYSETSAWIRFIAAGTCVTFSLAARQPRRQQLHNVRPRRTSFARRDPHRFQWSKSSLENDGYCPSPSAILFDYRESRFTGPADRPQRGIVPYWNSHMNRALSECIAPGPHGLVDYPQDIAELKRILHLHLKANGRRTSGTVPVAD